MAAAKVLDIWMRDCCAGFWGMVRRSGVTALVRNNNFPTAGQKKNTTNTHTLILLHTHTHAVLTRCMAELRGGCGSMSNWDGVCPTLWIWASVACSKRERKIQRKEEERERRREGGERESGLSVSIRIKVMGQCVTWQYKQTPFSPASPWRGACCGGGWLVTMSGWVSSKTHPKLPPPCPLQSLQSHPSVSMEETSLSLLTCFS